MPRDDSYSVTIILKKSLSFFRIVRARGLPVQLPSNQSVTELRKSINKTRKPRTLTKINFCPERQAAQTNAEKGYNNKHNISFEYAIRDSRLAAYGAVVL